MTTIAAEQNVLFIGGMFPRDEEDHVLSRSKGPAQMAANALQWTLVNGLDAAAGRPVRILNAVFVGSYPRLYKDLWIRGRRWEHSPGAHDQSVGFLNVFVIKHLWRVISLVARVWRVVSAAEWNSGGALLIYSMHAPFVLAGVIAKLLRPRLTLCMIVADLPEHMHLGEHTSRILRFMKGLDRWVMMAVMGRMDCFVLLTKDMAKPLAVGGRPWIVMEGAVDTAEMVHGEAADPLKDAEKIVLYTGTLTRAYGIMQLVDAMTQIPDPSVHLWICGAGEAEHDIRRRAKADDRIQYLGQVSRREALELQRRATVLVNPRPGAGEFTRYSFPSKIMEYMLSGTPTIVRRLPGMPEEYFDYVRVVDGDSSEALAKTIVEVANLPRAERVRIGERARQFVAERKSGPVQAGRILDLIRRASLASNAPQGRDRSA